MINEQYITFIKIERITKKKSINLKIKKRTKERRKNEYINNLKIRPKILLG